MRKSNYLAIILLLVLSFGISNANEDGDSLSTTTDVKTNISIESEVEDEVEVEVEDEDSLSTTTEIRADGSVEKEVEDRPMIRPNIGVKERMNSESTMSGSMIKVKRELKDSNRIRTGSGMKDEMEGIKEDIKTFKDDIKEVRNEKKEIISNNLRDLKENRSEIKSEFSLRSVLKGLNSELTDEIKTLDEEFRADIEALEEEIKANVGDFEKIKELRLELQEVRVAYNEKLISLVTDTEVKNTLTKRLELLKQNFELINSNIDARMEFRGKLNDKVSTYKDKLSTKLESGLPKVKEANIEKVLSKVDGIISTIENNTKITQVNKDKIMAQIIALKELLEEQLESNTSVQLDISAE